MMDDKRWEMEDRIWEGSGGRPIVKELLSWPRWGVRRDVARGVESGANSSALHTQPAVVSEPWRRHCLVRR